MQERNVKPKRGGMWDGKQKERRPSRAPLLGDQSRGFHGDLLNLGFCLGQLGQCNLKYTLVNYGFGLRITQV